MNGEEIKVEEIRVALEMEKLNVLNCPVGDPRRNYKQPRDDHDPYGQKLLIDRPCVFVDVSTVYPLCAPEYGSSGAHLKDCCCFQVAHSLGVMAKRSMGVGSPAICHNIYNFWNISLKPLWL